MEQRRVRYKSIPSHTERVKGWSLHTAVIRHPSGGTPSLLHDLFPLHPALNCNEPMHKCHLFQQHILICRVLGLSHEFVPLLRQDASESLKHFTSSELLPVNFLPNEVSVDIVEYMLQCAGRKCQMAERRDFEGRYSATWCGVLLKNGQHRKNNVFVC